MGPIAHADEENGDVYSFFVPSRPDEGQAIKSTMLLPVDALRQPVQKMK